MAKKDHPERMRLPLAAPSFPSKSRPAHGAAQLASGFRLSCRGGDSAQLAHIKDIWLRYGTGGPGAAVPVCRRAAMARVGRLQTDNSKKRLAC
jgi:hypothetical protein